MERDIQNIKTVISFLLNEYRIMGESSKFFLDRVSKDNADLLYFRQALKDLGIKLK